MLEIRDLHVSYRGIQAVRGVSLTVPDGAITCIIGRNGAGKSSLAGALAGIVRSSHGEITLGGARLSGRSAASRSRKGISLVPENRRIFGSLSARENVMLGAPGRASVRREAYARVRDLFPALTQFEDRAGNKLSGGEQQMVAIARALMCGPKLLILDEPSLGLAPIIVKRVMEAVERLGQQGQSILLIEQNARLALKISDHAWAMVLGELHYLDHRAAHFKESEIMSLYV